MHKVESRVLDVEASVVTVDCRCVVELEFFNEDVLPLPYQDLELLLNALPQRLEQLEVLVLIATIVISTDI